MPRPNSACHRRRHRRFTNVYSFTWPWRFIMARSAARLRRIVGPLASRKAVAGQTRQRDIIGHRPGLSGHIRTYPDKKWASHAVSSVAGSRAVKSVACERSRCRIACGKVGRVREEPVPDRVRYGPSLTHISSHPGPPRRPHISAMLTVRRTTRPSSAMSRPNSRL